MNEIGSEFWLDDIRVYNTHWNHPNDYLYFLSGRTALDFIIHDIKSTEQFTSISMPSYCCASMIEPFLRNGVDIRFYNVKPHSTGIKIDYDPSDPSDAVLLLDYFGYTDIALPRLAEQSKVVGKIIIYDGTHKLNGDPAVEAIADYTFCSFRKWFYINAASVVKRECRWNIEYAALPRNTRYETLRDEAARLKQEYISGSVVDKRLFLSLFSEAEDLLEYDYVGYTAEPASIAGLSDEDMNVLINKRRENARRLIDGLRTLRLPWLSLLRRTVGTDDCPLFVPAIIKFGLRDAVRRRLIENDIYCPVHWPLTKWHNNCNIEQFDQRLYETELSLVCDQRYCLSDMDRIIDVMKTIGDVI